MALSPVGKMYIVSAYTCLYGITNSQLFTRFLLLCKVNI